MNMATMQSTGLEYADQDEGEPILLVHAGGFAEWFAPLAASPTLKKFRKIRVRRAGYGSIPSAPRLMLADHAEHLQELARLLQLSKIHVVGHSSGALIALEFAKKHHNLIQTLTLIEPAACGPFEVPAIRDIGERFVGPAMAFFGAGNVTAAFDSFMRGVCGERYRRVFEGALGSTGLAQAVLQSGYFFRDEVSAAMQWQFSSEDARGIKSPILIIEGEAGRLEGLLSRQVTDVATKLFPQSEVVLIKGANHMVPLQRPDELGFALASFWAQHPITR
jgi:pimeloyl-ACP methyl ester carboxylesterase